MPGRLLLMNNVDEAYKNSNRNSLVAQSLHSKKVNSSYEGIAVGRANRLDGRILFIQH